MAVLQAVKQNRRSMRPNSLAILSCALKVRTTFKVDVWSAKNSKKKVICSGLVVIARGKHPIPSRTRTLRPAAPMVLWLKPRESRTPPNPIKSRKNDSLSDEKNQPKRRRGRTPVNAPDRPFAASASGMELSVARLESVAALSRTLCSEVTQKTNAKILNINFSGAWSISALNARKYLVARISGKGSSYRRAWACSMRPNAGPHFLNVMFYSWKIK